ncbi:hypothetical protein [uncultured Lacinutrix sp.]|uniref:hypothetical protein n=1 Tax=uncultured Lacinutrix sp. TaxID=574032 RepID=UPI0026350D0E|nr:hypothetical protein [uncultured Lacinutrix sp.]
MGYIICEIHGGNVAGLISEYHVEKINKMEESIDSEILNIEVLDKKGLFNGYYIVDPTLVNEIGIKESKINVESEFKKYEMMFDKLSPICPKCLNNYLKKE